MIHGCLHTNSKYKCAVLKKSREVSLKTAENMNTYCILLIRKGKARKEKKRK